MNDTKLTVSQWAATLGISRQSAYAAAHKLGIEVVAGKVSAERATAVYRAMTRPRASKKAASAAVEGDDAHVSYAEAKRRTAVAEAMQAERNEALAAGVSVNVEARDAAERRRAMFVRDTLEAWKFRLAGVLSHKSETEVFDLIDAEVRTMLTTISTTVLSGKAPT